MNESEVNILKSKLIPIPQEVEFRDGAEYLLQDGCKVHLIVAAPDGVAEKVISIFKSYWKVEISIKLDESDVPAQMKDDAYQLAVTDDLLAIKAKGLPGVMNACKTLRQLAEVQRGTEKVAGYFVVPCVIKDEPAVAFRGIHLCIFPETKLWDIEKQIRLAAYHKFNYAVIESWGVFPFESHPEFGWQDRQISRSDLKRLIHLGQELGITLVPQFNLLGHATASRSITGKHAILDVNPALQPLFEPDGWTWCISNSNVRRILTDLVLELYDFYEQPPFFHIGCDEADNIGTCRDCRRQELKTLVRDHICWFYELFKQRGVRVIMWHDMLIERGDKRWDGYTACGLPEHRLSELWKELPKDIIIADWQYGYKAGEDEAETPWPTTEFFQNAGFNVLVCPWLNVDGIKSLGKLAARKELMGMLETTWHISHDHRHTNIYGVAPNAAWNPTAELPKWLSLRLAVALHNRQIGWDMGIKEYEKTGWNMEQVDPGHHPHQLV